MAGRAGGSPLTIVVGVSGGIAAYKAVGLVRRLVRDGHCVHVVPTESALRFVGEPTFAAISRNPVVTDVFADASGISHIRLAKTADLVLVAPATANTIAGMAAGLAHDALGNVLLATTAPVLVAPAMHTEMWEHRATQANVQTLRSRGVVIVGPAHGDLAGDDVGFGRLEDTDIIAERALALIAERRQRSRGSEPHADWSGRRVVVTAGGTREPIDPVRFVGNRSSGKQGVALACAAAARGATVTLVAANIDDTVLGSAIACGGITIVPVGAAQELADSVASAATNADVILMAAAVADYRPVHVSDTKLKKSDHGTTMVIELEQTDDVLKNLVAAREAGLVIVGFAAETDDDPVRLLERGREKVRDKGCDYLVLNSVGWSKGISDDTNAVTVIDRDGRVVAEATGPKREVAARILDAVAPYL